MTERPRAGRLGRFAERHGRGDGPFARLASLAPVSIASVAFASISFSFAPVAVSQDQDPRGFAIQETRQAAALAELALEHIAALRHADAIAALQELIVSHRGHVLRPPDKDRESGEASEHIGASDWARARLIELPGDARKLYSTRYSAEARAALDSARRTRARRELIEIARRYPITPSARDAWWSVGDLELEL